MYMSFTQLLSKISKNVLYPFKEGHPGNIPQAKDCQRCLCQQFLLMYESSTSSDSALEPFQRQEHMTMMSSCTLAVELLQLLILWASSTNSAKCLQ